MQDQAPKLTIRKAKPQQLMIFIDLATSEGWHHSSYDAEYFYKADPNGFFVGEVNQQIVATISAVYYSNKIGHIGFWIVKSKYRHHGYGQQILKQALKYLDGANISTDCQINFKGVYINHGFKQYFKTLTMSGTIIDNAPDDSNLIKLDNIPFDEIIEYDKQVSNIQRPGFLQEYYKMPESHGIAYHKEGKLRGYGFIKKQSNKYRIGPLYADNKQIALNIINSLRAYPNNVAQILINPQQSNQQSIQLLHELKFKITEERIRMYTKQMPQIQYKKVYGILSRDIG